jgi:hypothetical protein
MKSVPNWIYYSHDFFGFSKLSIYFSWAELGIQVCFISEISVTWGPSVSHAIPVFALLLAERGGAARRSPRRSRAPLFLPRRSLELGLPE